MRQRRQPHGQKRDQPPSVILPLPKEVCQAAENGKRCDNVSLWLDRFLTIDPQNWEPTQDAKRRKRVMQLARQSQEYINTLQRRYEAMLDWYKQRGFVVKCFKAKPVWRFVVGLGAVHVLETGITLHRIFGLPIIPGSALKGAALAYAKLMEGRPDNDADLIAVFGTTEQAGNIIFLDAIPLEIPNFQLDIMNPHYPKYYRTQGQSPPADWESPTPVFFLTVSETPYNFAIAARNERGNKLFGLAEKWLKGALRELGIGAKTSADYGYWSVQ